jgi:hypothetical protein
VNGVTLIDGQSRQLNPGGAPLKAGDPGLTFWRQAGAEMPEIRNAPAPKAYKFVVTNL